jgi:hypothetical protein
MIAAFLEAFLLTVLAEVIRFFLAPVVGFFFLCVLIGIL